jgi:hypothetical protein
VTRPSSRRCTGEEISFFQLWSTEIMRHRIHAVIAPALVTTAVLIHPVELPAQSASPDPGVQLTALAAQRAAAWKRAAPVIHCGPAPLTERPEAAAELARPQHAPLEAAFLDAQRVKRVLASHRFPTGS